MSRIPEVLEVYVVGRIDEPVRIGREHPLVGELMVVAAGVWFLSPEEDERGGAMGSIRARPSRAHRREPGSSRPDWGLLS